jgi:hypothetical protein
MHYKYLIKPLAVQKIRAFYRNVSIKYSNTFSHDDMLRHVNDTVDAVYGIEHSLLRRRPTIERWKSWYMAHAGNWYYAYSIDGNTITIHDACHQQNMH